MIIVVLLASKFHFTLIEICMISTY